jgi:ankyrin repeat protein
MKLRNLAFGALALVLLALGGAWTLGHLMPLLTVRAAARSSPLTAAAMRPTTVELQRQLALHPPAGGDGQGLAALIWAARTGRPASIDLLARAGVDVDARDDGPNNWRPLHHAVHKGQLASVRALLAHGAAVDGTNPDGTTPLMLAAAQEEGGAIVEALLAAGADPRLRRPAGDSALTFAVLVGDERTIRALLARAPDLRLEGGFRTWVGRLALRLRGRGDLVALVDGRRGRP